MSNFTKGFLAVSASFLAVSIIEVAGTMVFRQGVGPITMLGLRSIIASILFFLTIMVSKGISFRIKKEDIFRLLLHSGIIVVHLLLFWYGLVATAHVPTVLALCITFPFWAMIISVIFLKEKFGRTRLFSFLLGGIGTLFAVNFLPALSMAHVNIKGVALISVSAIAWAAFWIIGKELLKKYNLFTILFYNFLFSAIVFTILAGPSAMINQVSLKAWLYILLVSVVSTYINYSLYYHGLKFIRVSTATLISLARPIISLTLAFFVLSQMLTIWQAFGAVIITGGTYLLYKENKDK